MLKDKLLRFCHTYKGEPTNPYDYQPQEVYWERERDCVKCIIQICQRYHVKLNINYFKNRKRSIEYIAMYLFASIPNVNREIRLMMPEYHIKYGETVFDKMAATDKEWEQFRKEYADVPKGGFTINHK